MAKENLFINIDTNKKRLSHEQTMAYIDEYQQTKDMKVKEYLVFDNLRLIHSLAKRFYQNTNQQEDLFQVGIIGLVKAIENFDTSYNLRFSTYAVPLILGEMKRYKRDNSPIKVSRTLKDIAYKALGIKEKYIQEYQREPTIQELSQILELPEKQIQDAMLSTNSVASFEESVSNEDGGSYTILDKISNEKGSQDDVNQSLDLHQALQTLSSLQQTIVDKRYYQGWSQVEIAKELVISQAQVSRMEKQALENLHKILKQS